jgi:hypothetical protein
MATTNRGSIYIEFIRCRPCNLCGNPQTEPHHSIRRLPGISEAGSLTIYGLLKSFKRPGKIRRLQYGTREKA